MIFPFWVPFVSFLFLRAFTRNFSPSLSLVITFSLTAKAFSSALKGTEKAFSSENRKYHNKRFYGAFFYGKKETEKLSR